MKPICNRSTFVLIISTLVLAGNVISAQESKRHAYKVWVKLYDNSNHKGYLFSVDDGSVNIVSKKNKEEQTNIKAKDIKTLMLKRKGKGWRSTLYGFLGATLATEIILLSTSRGGGGYISNEATAILTGVFFWQNVLNFTY